MRVLVTGGTGYVGEPVLKTLLEQGHEVRALVRDPSRLRVAGIEPFQGDVLDPATLLAAAQSCQACVNLVGVLREDPERGITFDKLHYQATRNLLTACQQVEMRRFVQMSANGAERGLPYAYFVSKAKAEVAVRASSLEAVILRPSVIYGGSSDRPSFVGMLESLFSWAPAVPYFSGPGFELAPVSAREVALAIGACLVHPDVAGKSFHLCGAEVYSYKDLLRLVRDLGGHKAVLFPLPFALARLPAVWLGKQRWFPATSDMLGMLKAGNIRPAGAPDFHGLLDVPEDSFKEWLLQGRDGQERPESEPAEPLTRAAPTRELYIPRIEDFPPGELPGAGEKNS